MKEKAKKDIPREEFSVEFGDINGTKLYEILQPRNEKKKSSKEK
jgi:hypothetical protein